MEKCDYIDQKIDDLKTRITRMESFFKGIAFIGITLIMLAAYIYNEDKSESISTDVVHNKRFEKIDDQYSKRFEKIDEIIKNVSERLLQLEVKTRMEKNK